MKEIVLGIAISLFVLLVILYPFKFKIALHSNVFEMVGFVSVKAFCFNLFSGKVMLTRVVSRPFPTKNLTFSLQCVTI